MTTVKPAERLQLGDVIVAGDVTSANGLWRMAPRVADSHDDET